MSIQKNSSYRHLKIQKLYRSGKEVPTIRLEGAWIENLGFKIGEIVTITMRERLLIIEPADTSVQENLSYKTILQEVKQTLNAFFQ